MASTSLLTDVYELMILQGVLASGVALWRSAFEPFGYRLPGPRRFDVVAGTGQLLDAIEAFTSAPTQIDFPHRVGVVNDETLDFLRDYRFSGVVRSCVEGECYFAGFSLPIVEGTSAKACILETLTLSTYNYDCAVAAAASRMAIAIHGRPCVDFGVHRVHEQAAVTVTRASVVGGFVGTSNLEARLLYSISTVGTSAHSSTPLHDTEEEAFAAQVASLGPNTTILVDTYDIATGVKRAVKAACVASGEFGAVRLGSGDLVVKAFKMHAQLDALGVTSTRIIVTNGLDKHVIAALGAAPVDSCGVGIKLVTGSGRPTTALIYKLVERKGADGTMEEVAKSSLGGKSTVGGCKWAGRILSSEGMAARELMVASSSQGEEMSASSRIGARPLQMLLVDEGRIIEEHRGKKALSVAVGRHRTLRAELPYDA